MNDSEWRELAAATMTVEGLTRLTDLAHAQAVLQDGRDIYAETVAALGYDPLEQVA